MCCFMSTSYGHWITVGPRERRGTNAYFLCRCVCGTERWISQPSLVNGMSKSCGCMRKLKPGQRFARLSVIQFISRERKYSCQCDCGKLTKVFTGHLTDGTTKSCGCLRKEFYKGKVWKSRTPEYLVWRSMLQRCGNPNHRAFQRYGGRGISVCERWRKFDNFISDMGHRPSPLHMLERTKNDEGYFPENCYWATAIEQNRNKSDNRFLTHNGVTRTMSQWAEIIGMSPSGFRNRIERGWSVSDAITKHPRSYPASILSG